MRGKILMIGLVMAALAGCSARVSAPIGAEATLSVANGGGDGEPDRVWVCHRGRWQSVAAPAADAHARHGDRVSSRSEASRSSC